MKVFLTSNRKEICAGNLDDWGWTVTWIYKSDVTNFNIK